MHCKENYMILILLITLAVYWRIPATFGTWVEKM
jgi:hypothetical protein